MTAERPLSALGERILEVLRDSGDKALTRKDIAKAIGRPRNLAEHDIHVLNDLIDAGLIEEEKRVQGTVKFAFYYRLK